MVLRWDESKVEDWTRQHTGDGSIMMQRWLYFTRRVVSWMKDNPRRKPGTELQRISMLEWTSQSPTRQVLRGFSYSNISSVFLFHSLPGIPSFVLWICTLCTQPIYLFFWPLPLLPSLHPPDCDLKGHFSPESAVYLNRSRLSDLHLLGGRGEKWGKNNSLVFFFFLLIKCEFSTRRGRSVWDLKAFFNLPERNPSYKTFLMFIEEIILKRPWERLNQWC